MTSLDVPKEATNQGQTYHAKKVGIALHPTKDRMEQELDVIYKADEDGIESMWEVPLCPK